LVVPRFDCIIFAAMLLINKYTLSDVTIRWS